MKSLSQLQVENHLILGMLRKWIYFGKIARYAPPKKYYESVNRLLKESESALQYCEVGRDTATHLPKE